MLIDRVARRLHDEDVGPADVLVDLKRNFGVGKTAQPRLPHRHAEKRRNLARELGVGAPREHFQFAEPGRHEGITHHRISRGASPPPHWRVGWGGRIRTFEYGIQSPAPYRLATPHHPVVARLWSSVVSPLASIARNGPDQHN